MVVGRDRRISGQAAIDRFSPQILLLDDGFQYYQLWCDLDIVLLNGADPFEGGWPLPAGDLREPAGHVKRADVLVLTGVEGQLMHTEALTRFGLPLYTGCRKSVRLQHQDGAVLDMDWLQSKPVGCFCGLGHPEQFEQGLTKLGADLRKSWRVGDHQAVTTSQLHGYWQQAQHLGCQALICTQKDMVKLPADCGSLPIYSLQIEMVFGADFWQWLDASVEAMLRPL